MKPNNKEYIVNMGFQDDAGRFYNAGQTLTQIEYNLLPMNMKVRCSENFQLDLGIGPWNNSNNSK